MHPSQITIKTDGRKFYVRCSNNDGASQGFQSDTFEGLLGQLDFCISTETGEALIGERLGADTFENGDRIKAFRRDRLTADEHLDSERVRGPLPQHELPGQPRVQRITDDQAVRNADKIIGDTHLIDDYAEAKAR